MTASKTVQEVREGRLYFEADQLVAIAWWNSEFKSWRVLHLDNSMGLTAPEGQLMVIQSEVLHDDGRHDGWIRAHLCEMLSMDVGDLMELSA